MTIDDSQPKQSFLPAKIKRILCKSSIKGRQTSTKRRRRRNASLFNLFLYVFLKSLNSRDDSAVEKIHWFFPDSVSLTRFYKFHHHPAPSYTIGISLTYFFMDSLSLLVFSSCLWSFAVYKETNLCVFLPRCWHHLIPPFFWSIITIIRLT